jgi:cytochrome c
MRLAPFLLLVVFSALAGVTIARSETAIETKGKKILEANCSRCHAIGETGTSPHAQAPPFRTVVTRYAPANLAEALAEGIASGHPDMPEFVFEPAEIDAIVAYLDNLSQQQEK